MYIVRRKTRDSVVLLNTFFLIFQGTLVPKLTFGTFLTLIVKNGHKLTDWVFGIPAYIQSKRTTIPNFKLFLSQNYKRSFFNIKALGHI